MLNLAVKNFTFIFFTALVFGIFISARADEPTLGDAPRAPKDVSGLPGAGVRPKSVTGGFSVDTTSREQVRSFYNAIYPTSTNVPMNTTADVSSCTPGTNATAFNEVVLRRINWFRAMAGLPASVTFNDNNNSNDQSAALMMSANNTLQHVGIPPTWSCFDPGGTNAASMSNLALGNNGADAITSYIWDFGSGNFEVGHRRWILFPQTQVMGTGDIPQTNITTATQTNLYFAANATWIFDANLYGIRPATRQPFVSWPPAGYVPYQVVYPQWSFALTNANFTNAIITMKSNGVSLAVSVQPYVTGYGENTLVWYPTALDPTTSTTTFPFSGVDTVYTVTVTNILYNGATVGYTYTVTLFDPAVPGADYFPPIISGTNQPAINTANVYTFTALTNVTGYQWRSAQRLSGNLFDGAEGGLTNFTAITTAGYSVITNGLASSGTHSFHLAHPQPENQFLQLNEIVLPTNNTYITFKSLLGYAFPSQVAKLQVSTDGGGNWQDLYSLAGNGSQTESVYSAHTYSLSNYLGQATLLRFTYQIASTGSYYPQTSVSPPVGWFIDDILVTNTEQLVNFATNSVVSANFTFIPTQIGNYILQADGVLYDAFPINWGPAKLVTAVVGPAVIILAAPVISGNQVQLNFSISGTNLTFKLLQANQLNGVWTTNAGATLTTNIFGSSYLFTTTNGPATRFYRIQSP